MKRVANDAQTDRLIRALHRPDGKPGLSEYGKQLAKATAQREGKAYRTVERRFQRYITTASQRRSFASAPVEVRRSVRLVARSVPLPPPPPRAPIERPVIERPPVRYDQRYDDEPPLRHVEPPRREYLEPFERETTDSYELRAIIAYHDGNVREVGKVLGVDSRIIDLASQGVTISASMGKPEIDAGVRDFYDDISDDDAENIERFSDMLRNMPEWEISMLMDDLADGNTTFATWFDLWRNANYDYDELLDDGDFWEIWREAYERATG